MFQFPEFALTSLCIQLAVTPKGRVSPFRYPRIKAYCQLPVAFRRLSRLSSPVIAKASTICTYSLDPITLSPDHRWPGVIVFRILLPCCLSNLSIRLAQRFVSDPRQTITSHLVGVFCRLSGMASCHINLEPA